MQSIEKYFCNYSKVLTSSGKHCEILLSTCACESSTNKSCQVSKVLELLDILPTANQCCSKGKTAVPNQINFRKSSKGGGVIFNPKIYVADFWNFKQGILIMKLIQNSNFRVQGMFFQQLY